MGNKVHLNCIFFPFGDCLARILSYSEVIMTTCRRAVFEIFKKSETTKLNWFEIIIVLGVYGICYVIKVTDVDIAVVI